MRRPRVLPILATMMSLSLGVAALAATGAKVRAGKVNPITVDGAIDDWKGVPVAYYQDGPRLTAIAHDGSTLYVHFRFADPALMRRVRQAGATLWLNCSTTHKMSSGLRYHGSWAIEKALGEKPHGTPPSETTAGGAPSGGKHRSGSKGKEPEPLPIGALEILQDGTVAEVIDTGKKPDGPGAASGVVEDAFVFEFSIPFATLCPEAQPGNTSLPAKVSIGFQIGGVSMAEIKGVVGGIHAEDINPGRRYRDGFAQTNRDRRGNMTGRTGVDDPYTGDPTRESEEPIQVVEVFWVDVEVLDKALPASTTN